MNKPIPFERKQGHRAWHDNAWRFAVAYVVEGLTDSANPAGYLRNIRFGDLAPSELFKGGVQVGPPLRPQHPYSGGRAGDVSNRLARKTDAQRPAENLATPKQDGRIAGNASGKTEARSGRAVSAKESFKELAATARQFRGEAKDYTP